MAARGRCTLPKPRGISSAELTAEPSSKMAAKAAPMGKGSAPDHNCSKNKSPKTSLFVVTMVRTPEPSLAATAELSAPKGVAPLRCGRSARSGRSSLSSLARREPRSPTPKQGGVKQRGTLRQPQGKRAYQVVQLPSL